MINEVNYSQPFPIKMFYHFFISPDERGLFWNWWLDEQAEDMISSNLSQYIPISMYVTMPKFWDRIYDLPIYANGTDDEITLEEKLREYTSIRYPFLNIEEVRDTGEPNLFEGSTLLPLWEYSKANPNKYVAYIHTKGVMSVGVHSKCWREVLNKNFISDWRVRYRDLLFGHDVVGMKDKQCDDTILSGNFWWASTNYIATLEQPLYDDRYQYEKWILSGNPKTCIIRNTNVDHFKEYYFREQDDGIQYY